MTFKGLFLGSLLLLAGCVSTPIENEVVPLVQPLAVTVTTDRGSGSGVWISDRHILTAKHVVKGWDSFEKHVWVESHDGQELRPATLIAWEQEGEGMINYDWAILEIDDPDFRAAAWAQVECADPLIGERVVGIGNAHGYTGLLPYLGYVQWVHYDPSGLVQGMEGYWKDAILTNMGGAPGVSGGPVFNMAGRLIGMMVGAFDDQRSGTFLQITYPVRAIGALC